MELINTRADLIAEREFTSYDLFAFVSLEIAGNQTKVCMCVYTATESILTTDAWTVTLEEVGSSAREYDTGIYAGGGAYNEASLLVENRTA